MMTRSRRDYTHHLGNIIIFLLRGKGQVHRLRWNLREESRLLTAVWHFFFLKSRCLNIRETWTIDQSDRWRRWKGGVIRKSLRVTWRVFFNFSRSSFREQSQLAAFLFSVASYLRALLFSPSFGFAAPFSLLVLNGNWRNLQSLPVKSFRSSSPLSKSYFRTQFFSKRKYKRLLFDFWGYYTIQIINTRLINTLFYSR